jgi:cytochrome c553
MLNKIFFLVVAVSVSLYSCDTTEEPSSTGKKSTWSPKMDEPSELAQIMRDLHEEGLQRKASLENEELFSGSVVNLLKMIAATPTEPHMKGPAFEPHALAFNASYAAIQSASTVNQQIDAHNNLVKSCVACHTNFCQGPISRIELLYIN